MSLPLAICLLAPAGSRAAPPADDQSAPASTSSTAPTTDLPVSLDRIRRALAERPPDPLQLDSPQAHFRVEIRERLRFEEIIASLDFKTGPMPPGGVYAYDWMRQFDPEWFTTQVPSVDMLPLFRRIAAAISKASRAHAEAEARREVSRAIEEFCAAQPPLVAAGIQVCAKR